MATTVATQVPAVESPAARARADVAALLRSRQSLLWVQTADEFRGERGLVEAGASVGLVAYIHDASRGLCDAAGNPLAPNAELGIPDGAELGPLPKLLQYIRARLTRLPEHRALYILRDADDYLREPILVRAVRTLARECAAAPLRRAQALVILTPSGDVPAKLAPDCELIRWPRPDQAELAAIWDSIIDRQPEEVQARARTNGKRERSVGAFLGLEASGASRCLARSLVRTGDSDPTRIAEAKRAAVEMESSTVWIEPDPRGLDAIGGNTGLKAWVLERLCLFSEDARAFGLEPLRGLLITGVSGTGKSLCFKALGTALRLPVILFKPSSTESKWVGEGVQNLRRVLSLVDSLGPCILAIDEVEKQLAGSSGEQGDGGSGRKLLGELLTWLQDRRSQAFVVFTANDVTGLPPELTRKGRVDEVFFVDLPNGKDRAEILAVALRERGRDLTDIDAAAVAGATRGFTGAEITALVQPALLRAYRDGKRSLATEDLLAAARATVPLSALRREDVDNLRAWAKGRAVRANDAEDETVSTGQLPELQF
jgi:hypothetical protein